MTRNGVWAVSCSLLLIGMTAVLSGVVTPQSWQVWFGMGVMFAAAGLLLIAVIDGG